MTSLTTFVSGANEALVIKVLWSLPSTRNRNRPWHSEVQVYLQNVSHESLSRCNPSTDRSSRNPSSSLIRARHDASTSNLLNHLTKCAPKKKGTIVKHIPGANYTKALMRMLLMLWVARRHRPYAIVEDPELRRIFTMLYAMVEVPSARTISRDVIEIFEMSRRNIVSMLEVCNSYTLRAISVLLMRPPFCRPIPVNST